MRQLIGRKEEQDNLTRHYNSYKSEFVVVYGRRRVGKTFLIRQTFQDKFAFHSTGLANATMHEQLAQFHAALIKYAPETEIQASVPKDWFNAFLQLIKLLEKLPKEEKKIIFIDEMPWMDTPKSRFLIGLEYFWNSWASGRDDILLIVCGSAASWIVKNLLNNRGGLHNRVTDRMHLAPFNLQETEAFLKFKKIDFTRYQILMTYMVFGGIPYYIDLLRRGESMIQGINRLAFSFNAILRLEYDNLYTSLFSTPERHVSIIEALATKGKGLNRRQIIEETKLKDGGTLTRILKELVESNFIRRYKPFGKKKRDSLYQLIDSYSLFYLRFIKNSDENDEDFWKDMNDTPRFYNWSGYAFEIVCLHHIKQIKKALGISGVSTSVASWQNKEVQIDLLIDRKDQVINLCEMKFSVEPFLIDKNYQANLRKKKSVFRQTTGTKKAIWLTMISSYGTTNGIHSDVLQHDLTMDVLFEK